MPQDGPTSETRVLTDAGALRRNGARSDAASATQRNERQLTRRLPQLHRTLRRLPQPPLPPRLHRSHRHHPWAKMTMMMRTMTTEIPR